MANHRGSDLQIGKRKRRRGRRNRQGDTLLLQKSTAPTPAQILDRLLELIPIEKELPITKLDLVLLYHAVGCKIDQPADLCGFVERFLDRFDLESGAHLNPRRPSYVLGVLMGSIPFFTRLSISAEELDRLERAIGKTSLAIDTTSEEVSCPLTAAELVTFGFGEITTKEAASLAGVSHRSILRDVRVGKLRGRRRGGRYRFIESRSLRTYLERQSRTPPSEDKNS